jgi:hypothetical protein
MFRCKTISHIKGSLITQVGGWIWLPPREINNESEGLVLDKSDSNFEHYNKEPRGFWTRDKTIPVRYQEQGRMGSRHETVI